MNSYEHSYEFLKLEDQDGVLILTLNREDKLNALNIQVLQELKHLFTDLSSDYQHVKGIIFTGAGEKAFIAGADIAAMSEMDAKSGFEFAELGQQVSLLIEKLPVPVIAAVNGYALGGGCEMALSCDFILATANAQFGLPEVSLGLIPGFGGTQRLARIIGRNKAKELIYTGALIKAEEALSLGMALYCFTNKSELIEQAVNLIRKINKNSPYAIGIAKKVINEGIDLTVEAGLDLEKKQFAEIFNSFDQKEGCKAFVEKRKANFQGK